MEVNDDVIAVSSDHAGFELKEHVKAELDGLGVPYEDMGVNNPGESVDYPVFAGKVARAVAAGRFSRGIVICGTGLGASMTANRFRGVRAALCVTEEMARLSREHNNANVLAMGGRITRPDVALRILRTWLDTGFEGDRHVRRISLIDEVVAWTDEEQEPRDRRGDVGHEKTE